MLILCLLSGLVLAFIDIYWEIRSLKQNISKRICFVTAGICGLWFVDKRYLCISYRSAFYGLEVGTGFMCIHLLMAKGAKLRKDDVSKGLIYTSVLMYVLELPAEEFLYKGVIFVPLVKLIHPLEAILLTSAIFLWLHVKSWNNRFVYFGAGMCYKCLPYKEYLDAHIDSFSEQFRVHDSGQRRVGSHFTCLCPNTDGSWI
jgi:hypothetical protein